MGQDAILCYNKDRHEVVCQGDWNLAHLPQLEESIQTLAITGPDHIQVNGQRINSMDSAGAYVLCEWEKGLNQSGVSVALIHFKDSYTLLIDIVKQAIKKEKTEPKASTTSRLENIGKYFVDQAKEFIHYLSFLGFIVTEYGRVITKPKGLRIPAIATVIYRAGLLGLPIIGLLSLLIGVVLAYQMGLQLRSYGANMYIVDLLGLAVLREFGPLITAIMVAGRSGSAYTAQLGIMKINQEIDALNTMGVTPAELLLLPRITGLLIVLPLLTIWSDIFSIIGGIVMSKNMLNVSPYDFLTRFPHAVKLKSLLIGLGKAPIFALIIASIGCFQGMKVEGSADSVGRNTTRSVVLAIFFIIVADAFFSIILSQMRL